MSNRTLMNTGEIELLDEECWSPADELYAEVMSVGRAKRFVRFDDEIN